VTLAGGVACTSRAPAQECMSVKEAFQLAEARHGTLGSVGWYQSPKLGGDYRGGTIGASPAYSFTAHVAEVACDPETGRVDVKKIWIAHDCGRALNPVDGRGPDGRQRIHGVRRGHLRGAGLQAGGPRPRSRAPPRPSLLDYRIPTSLDTPELESIIVESVDPEGPYGAKEAGEGPLHPSIPAIANAIYDALGIRCDRLPFDPPRVLKLLRAADARAQWERARAQVRDPAPVRSPGARARLEVTCSRSRRSSGPGPARWRRRSRR
jgi:CO/xanthine dehydrogenase Mo-binding subunit